MDMTLYNFVLSDWSCTARPIQSPIIIQSQPTRCQCPPSRRRRPKTHFSSNSTRFPNASGLFLSSRHVPDASSETFLLLRTIDAFTTTGRSMPRRILLFNLRVLGDTPCQTAPSSFRSMLHLRCTLASYADLEQAVISPSPGFLVKIHILNAYRCHPSGNVGVLVASVATLGESSHCRDAKRFPLSVTD